MSDLQNLGPNDFSASRPSDAEGSGWERKLLERLASEALVEQRRRRRWGIFFKSIGVLYFGLLIVLWVDWPNATKNKITQHTALVNLQGVIDSDGMASAERINSSLDAAFSDKNTVGVILRINSPGGSPVQAGLIYDEIKRLRKEHPKIPIYAVVEEICASGGYYVAAAADRIYVNKSSLVGSIGVLMDGFGFEEGMKKLGVERRLLTAGENKGFLDPFSPVNSKQKEIAQQMLEEIHQQFIAVVREGRGARLKETPDMFSGLVWTGATSVKLGLSDALGTIDGVARDVIKVEDILDFTEQESFAERVAKRVGVSFGKSFSSALLSSNGSALR
ncbi:MAG: S49 family peptidase [Burkholderiaceae bacterium]|jgi:protease-4